MLLKVPDIKPLLQPARGGLCGQTCVAMAAGVPLDDAIAAVGTTTLKEEGTQVYELSRGLKKLGVKIGKPTAHKLKGATRLVDMPERAILGIDKAVGPGHWALLWDGFVYDPGVGWPIPVRIYETFIMEGLFSRIYKRQKSRSRRAFWDTVIPILG